MDIYEKKEACCGCGACRDICPVGAVDMVMDREGFFYPKVNRQKCIQCRRCEQVCPIKRGKNRERENLYFGVQAKSKEIRYASSSGGMFPVLAGYVFQRKGVVYGAAFGENMELAHIGVQDADKLVALKKTKYVQSTMTGVYCCIQEQLKEDRWVLFCGTPCQAHALRLFLNQEYQKLIVMDIVCYGAPSPGVWASYVRHLEKKSGGKLTEFYFRDKRNQDNGHVCSYMIDGREQAESLYENVYCRMYFKNEIIRPSCHVCKYCTPDRDSDFTVGDFWGIEKIKLDMDDGMGTSVVILHTEKAKEIWKQVKEELRWFTCKREEVLQPRLKTPTVSAWSRGLFMCFYKILPFSLLCSLFNSFVFWKSLWRRRIK